MNTIKHLKTMALMLMASLAYSQTSSYSVAEPPYIEVTGTAEKEVIPDEIYIGITIREKYVNKVKVTIEDQEEKLKTVVKSLGIDITNLFLSDANADFVIIRWLKKDVLTKKDYTLKVSSAALLGQIFLELEKLEITDAYISRVNYSKMDSLRKEIKILAIKAAKHKADYLLIAIGEQSGKPLLIKEDEILPNTTLANINFRDIPSRDEVNYFTSEKRKYDADNEIQFQKIKLQARIYVKFSIK